MRQRHTGEADALLGYLAGVRLIINADDFGMCHAINAPILHSLTAGIACFRISSS